MTAKFCYGLRDGYLVHVSDLDCHASRGLSCACSCPDCRRALVAHMGSVKEWHFQHHVASTGCTPEPMTLLHAYVRDELARRRELTIPAQKHAVVIDESYAKGVYWVEVPANMLDIRHAETEARDGSVQPDVSYVLAGGQRFALEVRYAHAVDDEKRRRLSERYQAAVEFDVSDLPAEGVGAAQLGILLTQGHRWRWLVNGGVAYAEGRLRDKVAWASRHWRPRQRPSHVIVPARPASQKLRKAQTRLPWATAALAKLREERLDAGAAAAWLGSQDVIDRVAIACAALGLEPASLPDVFQQSLEQGLGHHCYSWQVVVFMKFGIGTKPFATQEAAQWAQVALPDRVARSPEVLSLNGFNRTAAAVQTYFLALEAQGFILSRGQRALEERTFRPRFATAADFRHYLTTRLDSERSFGEAVAR